MLPGLKYTLNELRTLFQKSWEWRIGYVLIAGFIAARWLGVFSSMELVALDFFLRHRPAEGEDEHVVIVLIDRDSIQKGDNVSDHQIVQLLKFILAAEPAAVGLNLFREDAVDVPGRSELIQLFEIHDNLIGVQKALPPKAIQPLRGIPDMIAEEQFGLNDVPIDRDGRIRRVFVGTYLPQSQSQAPENYPFKFSFSFKLAETFLANHGYSVENSPYDPNSLSFLQTQSGQYHQLPRLTTTFGGYVRDKNVGQLQTLLNFRSGNRTFEVFDAIDLLAGELDPENFKDKVVIIGGTDSFFPRFLPVSAVSNPIAQYNVAQEITPRFGILGAELEAHASSQIINSVLYNRPLIRAVHPFFEDILIVLAGITGILIGNAFQQTPTTIRNAFLLLVSIVLWLIISYLLLCSLGIWLPIIPTSFILATTGITYIAFYQSERLAIMEANKLEEERRKAIERTFNSIHAGPLQTLAGLLRNVRDGKLDQDYLLGDLEFLNREIRSIGERLRQDAIEDVYFVDNRRDIKLDLNHPMNEVFYEIYNLCLQKDLPGFQTIKIRSVAFDAFNCQFLPLEMKRKLCLFLQESLENVGKHALGTTKLIVTGKVMEEFYTLSVEDNGPGLTSSHVGEGTQFFFRLEEDLRGKYSRISKPTGGTVCKLSWALCEKSMSYPDALF
jgi:CHASE2 domain-containing sensor protein